MPPRKRLGQLLTELKVIDEHQLQSALGHQKQWGGKLGAILVQKGFCREDQMTSALSQHLGMPAVRLSEVKIDPRAVKTVSKSVAERLHVFAYEVTGAGRSEVITIAMSDPTDLSAVDQLAFHTGKRIKPMLAGDSEVIAAIQQHYTSETPAQGVQALPAGSRPFVEGAEKGPGGTMRATPVAPLAPVSPGATPTPVYNKRVDPPRPPPPVMGLAPMAGGPAPAADAAAAVDAVGLEGEDLPADAPMEGLEPIAAHSQGEQSVEGAEEVAFETETTARPQPAADRGWTVTAELPIDAIMGTAEVLDTPAENAPVASDAPDAWSDIADPLAAPAPEGGAGAEAAWAAAAADVAAAADEPAGATAAEETPDDARREAQEGFASAAEGDSLLEPPGDSPADVEEVAIEAEGWSDENAPPADEAQAQASAGQDPDLAMEAETQLAEAEGSATQSQAWLGRTVGDDQQVEGDEGAAAYGEEVQYTEDSTGAADAQPAEQGYAEGASSAEAEAGYAEETQYAEQDTAGSELPSDSAGWFGDALSSTMPLSPSDLGTLAALGLDPSDGAAAQRALACLVRVLNRRQAIDLDELAAEIRESRMAGEAAAQAQVDEQAAADPGAGDVGEPGEQGAQTSGSGQDPWTGSHGT